MEKRNIVNTYVIRGICIGFFFPVISVLGCIYLFSPDDTSHTLASLHRDFPLLWIIDSAPLVLGVISYVVGKNVNRVGRIYFDKINLINLHISHHLNVINNFSTVIQKGKDIDDVVWSVAKNAVAELGYVDCVIYLLDEENQVLIQKAAHGNKNPEERQILGPIEIKVGDGVVGTVAATGKGEIVNDTSQDPRYILDDEPRLSEITVPMVHDGKVIGIIDSEHPEKNFFSKDHLALLYTIASMTATKLVQTRYNDELRAYQTQLEKMVDEKTIALQEALAKVETHQKELKDSIRYAKQLQEAILPHPKTGKGPNVDSFVFYQPKDIVSGDFYAREDRDGIILFAAADCTGHGVPGAMLSFVCFNALNSASREIQVTDPAKILDRVRELVIETFEKSEAAVNDGMDIALCALDQKGGELIYSGAYSPLYIVKEIDDYKTERDPSNDTHYLHQVKGDPQPIGNYFNMQSFTNHTIPISKGDTIYLSTDGFEDQFGGKRGKKFGKKRFRELLFANHEQPMKDQKALLHKTFTKWKEDLDQVDDVLVLGVRL